MDILFGFPPHPYPSVETRQAHRHDRPTTMRADRNGYEKTGCEKHIRLSLWALTDSNRRPSACKADALNQLS